MKNQYFGDIHDFKKYTLLNWFMKGCNDKLMVAWYLTNDDDSSDGGKKKYLEEKIDKENKEFEKNKHIGICNRELFEFLVKNHQKKNIGVIMEKTNKKYICENGNISFFDKKLDDMDRKEWFNELKQELNKTQCDIVFADPDNGIKFNNEESKKHIKLSEIKELWKMGKSLIVYQHFLMVDHQVLMAGLIYRLYNELKAINKPFVAIVYSSNVAMIFILQQKNKKQFESLKKQLEKCKDLKFLDVFSFNSENIKI